MLFSPIERMLGQNLIDVCGTSPLRLSPIFIPKQIPLTFERQRLSTPRSHAITQDGANVASKRNNVADRDSEFHHG